MKKLQLSVWMLLATAGMLQAQQQLNNPGFEQWDTIGDYTQPKNWYTLNPLTAFGFDPTTTMTNVSHSGNYAVVLESKAGSSTNLTGLISSGPILSPSGSADFSKMQIPFTSKPSHLRFYYKTYPASGDTTLFYMALTKWNQNTAANDTVADALFMGGATVSTFTLADIPFVYYTTAQPDSAFVIATSSADGFNPTVGSRFIIDDISLYYSPAGVASHIVSPQTKVYPNPSTGMVNINTGDELPYAVTLFDGAGRTVLYRGGLNQASQLDLSGLDAGVYVMLIEGAHSKVQYTKIMLQH